MSALKDDAAKFNVVGICDTCQRRRGIWTCEAYPTRIPTSILIGDQDHHTPLPGDQGLIYVAMNDLKKLNYREQIGKAT